MTNTHQVNEQMTQLYSRLEVLAEKMNNVRQIFGLDTIEFIQNKAQAMSNVAPFPSNLFEEDTLNDIVANVPAQPEVKVEQTREAIQEMTNAAQAVDDTIASMDNDEILNVMGIQLD